MFSHQTCFFNTAKKFLKTVNISFFIALFFYFYTQKMCSWYKETYRCSSYIINYPNHKYGWYNLKNLGDSYTFFSVFPIFNESCSKLRIHGSYWEFLSIKIINSRKKIETLSNINLPQVIQQFQFFFIKFSIFAKVIFMI